MDKRISMSGDWIASESGTVRRNYDYLADAASDIEAAQREGWRVDQVVVEGKRLEAIGRSSWLKELWAPRLVEQVDGTVRLRRQPSIFNGRGRHVMDLVAAAAGGGVQGGDNVEVEFSRRE